MQRIAPVREQVKKLQGAAVMEWQHIRKASESMHEIPKHGYVRRIEDVGMHLSERLPSRKAGRRLRTRQPPRLFVAGSWDGFCHGF